MRLCASCYAEWQIYLTLSIIMAHFSGLIKQYFIDRDKIIPLFL